MKNGTGCIVIPSHATLLQLPSDQGFAPTPRKEPEVSDSAVRKKSEVRQKTVVRTLRFSPVEDETIREKKLKIPDLLYLLTSEMQH